MANSEHINLLLDELKRYGLRGEVNDRGKHLEVRWEVAGIGERFVIAPRTPSDWRSGMNTRSDLRKMLRKDGLQPKQELSFQKAMSLPDPVLVTSQQRDSALKNDVEALTDLVFELQEQINRLAAENTLLQDKMNSARVVSRIEFAGKERVEDADVVLEVSRKLFDDATAPRQKPKRDQILALLSFQYKPRKWIMEQALKTIDTTKASINQTLAKAKREGIVETGLRGMWRLKPHD